MENTAKHPLIGLNPNFDSFIESLVAHVRSDQIQIETQTSSPAIENFYSSIFSRDLDQLAKINIDNSNLYFIGKIIADYVGCLTTEYNYNPEKLAFFFDNSTVLVWAQIKDDDTESERFLILAEAKVNGKYFQYGFQIDTTIVEESDRISIPNHYTIFGKNWRVLKSI